MSGGHLVYLELHLTSTPMAVESDDSDDLVETSLARPKATFKSGEGGWLGLGYGSGNSG